MKTVYTILFFLDLCILICLAFILLKLIDAGGHTWQTTLVGLGMLGCILMLIAVLARYVRPYR